MRHVRSSQVRCSSSPGHGMVPNEQECVTGTLDRFTLKATKTMTSKKGV